jgi:hypothetical protein
VTTGTGETRMALIDLAHGGVEAARRVHLQDHQLLAEPGGAGDAVHDVIGVGRADGAVDGQQGRRLRRHGRQAA